MNKLISYISNTIDLSFIYSKYYSFARLFLSLSTFCTIAFNDVDRLFNISFIQHPNIKTVYLSEYSIFNLFYSENLLLAKIISCVLLIIIMLGFIPRITCFLQWWLSFSIYASSYITEGGDQINMILSFLIIPICLLDNRMNQWTSKFVPINNLEIQKITVFFSLILIKVQIAVLYFMAGFGKIYNDQWREGTALYYWVSNNNIGFGKFIEPVFLYIFSNRYILFFSTWGIMVFEMVLSIILLTNINKRIFFYLAILFHISIFVCFGLFSFGISMSASLLLYFLPFNRKLNFL